MMRLSCTLVSGLIRLMVRLSVWYKHGGSRSDLQARQRACAALQALRCRLGGQPALRVSLG